MKNINKINYGFIDFLQPIVVLVSTGESTDGFVKLQDFLSWYLGVLLPVLLVIVACAFIRTTHYNDQ